MFGGHGMESCTVLKRLRRRTEFVAGDSFGSRHAMSYLDLEVRPRSKGRALDSSGGGLTPCHFQFAPVLGMVSFPVHAMRWVNVPRCTWVQVATRTWAEGRQRVTKSCVSFLVNWSRCWPWQDFARVVHDSWDNLRLAGGMAVAWDRAALPSASEEDVSAFGVDEIAWLSNCCCWFLIDQWHASWVCWPWGDRVVGARPWKTSENGSGLGVQCAWGVSASVRQQAYRNAVRRRSRQPLQVLDRFHGMRQLGEMADRARVSEVPDLKRQRRKPRLSLTRWRWLQSAVNLTEERQLKLTTLELDPRTVRMNGLQEDFQPFWNCRFGSPRQADGFRPRQCRLTMRSRLPPTQRVAHASAARGVEWQGETVPQKNVWVQVLRIRCDRLGSSRGRSTSIRTSPQVLLKGELYLQKP